MDSCSAAGVVVASTKPLAAAKLRASNARSKLSVAPASKYTTVWVRLVPLPRASVSWGRASAVPRWKGVLLGVVRRSALAKAMLPVVWPASTRTKKPWPSGSTLVPVLVLWPFT